MKLLEQMIKNFKAQFVVMLVPLILLGSCALNSKGFKPHLKSKKDCNCSHWSWIPGEKNKSEINAFSLRDFYFQNKIKS